MTLIHGNSYSAINLIYNGGWELKEENTPAFWLFDNLANTGLNTYSLNDDGLRVTLGGSAPSAIYQDFRSFPCPTDFRVPALGGLYRGMASGYVTTHGRPLGIRTPYTVSFDVHREVGSIRFRVFFSTGASRVFLPEQIVSIEDNTRLNFVFTPESAVDAVGIEFSASKTSVFTIDRIMLAAGSYDELPYTGDPFLQVFPADCIILTLGSVCPPGFTELGEGDFTPPADWTKAEAGVRARKGNYPRSGTELAGSPKHTIEDPQMRQGTLGFLEFEGFEGKLFVENNDRDTNVPVAQRVFTIYNSNPDVDAAVPHTHSLSEGESRPLSLGLLFCKRL